MAMCFAVLGLKVPGIKIKNPGVREEDVPEFFPETRRAAAAWSGRDNSGNAKNADAEISGEELFAE